MSERVPESDVNRIVRRVDWRFLLPSAVGRAIVAGSSALLVRAAEREWGTARDGEEAVLAVLVNPATAQLQAAKSRLRTDGGLYVEWRGRRPGTVRSVRRRLAAAGLDASGVYWPWPDPERDAPKAWIPLDGPNATAFHLRHRAGKRRAPWRAALERGAWTVARRLGLLSPVCVTIPSASTGDDLERSLRALRASEADGPRPAEIRWLLLAPGRRSGSKPVAFVFFDGQPEPDVAVKFARTDASGAALLNEARCLTALAERAPTVTGTPRLLFRATRGGRPAIGLTYHSGRPLLELLDEQSLPRLVTRGTDWLVALATATARPPTADWRQRLIWNPLEDWARNFAPIIDPEELESTRRALGEIEITHLVFEHRDTSPWNILVAESGELTVLDWESAEPDGLPGLDLAYFLTYAMLGARGAIEGPRAQDAFAKTLDPAHADGASIAAAERTYALKTNVSGEQLRRARLLTWITHACGEYGRLLADGGGQASVEMLERSVFIGFWRQELRRLTG